MKKSIYIFILFSIFSAACLNKTLSVEVIEPACEDVSIGGIKYDFIADPTCYAEYTVGRLSVKGTIVGETSCIDSMFVNVEFFDIDGNKLVPSESGSNRYGPNDISITGSSFSLNINYTFPNNDYSRINYIHLNYSASNELGSITNELSLRANPECVSIKPPSRFDEIITVDDSVRFIVINFFDNAAEDGDLISLNVNGEWALENLFLTNEGVNYAVPVKRGSNWFYIYALNQGSSGPNTVSVRLSTDDPNGTVEFDLGLKTGESKSFLVNIR